ncbi:MAG: hypothetical protein HQL21_01730 [Candidatus Omnitrophica bacterium]|nr:hypothetical protein [Candidatus Omnitrophota bacterium]
MIRINLEECLSFLKTVFFFCAVIAFLIGIFICFVPEHNTARWWLSYTSFYFISALFLLWLVTLLSPDPKSQPSSYINFSSLLFTGIAILLTTTIFVMNPPRLRLHTDEVLLLGTSRTLYTEKTIHIPQDAVLSNNRLEIIRTSLPFRPLLFSFLTNLVHRCKGYNFHNVFILNFIGLSLLLILAGAFIGKHWGIAAGIATQFAIVSHPIIWHTASSGIADIFHALFFFISALTLRKHLHTPSPRSIALLILSLCLLGNIRFESIIFLFITIPALLLFRRISWEHVQSAKLIIVLTAVCSLPFFWQRSIFIDLPQIYGATITNFSLEYFLKFFPISVSTFLSLDPSFLYYFTPLLTLGVTAIILLILKIILNIKKTPLSKENEFFLWLTICVVLHQILICSFTGGFIGGYTRARYFMIEAIFLSTLATIFLFSYSKNLFLRIFLSITFPLLFIFQLHLAPELQKEEIKGCPQATYFQAVYNLVHNLEPQKSLLVIDYPIEYILRGWPSIHPKVFTTQTSSIKEAWDTHEYKAIYYIEKSKNNRQRAELKGDWTAKFLQTSMLSRNSFVTLYTLEPK